MDERINKLLKRIRTDSTIPGDGEEFIEYLQTLSKDNYESFKSHPAEMNDVHKGYALCVDFLLDCFANCDKQVELTEQDELAEEAFR